MPLDNHHSNLEQFLSVIHSVFYTVSLHAASKVCLSVSEQFEQQCTQLFVLKGGIRLLFVASKLSEKLLTFCLYQNMSVPENMFY